MMNAPLSILLVDDEPLLRRATALMLSNLGGSVSAAATPEEAVALAALCPYDVVIFDVSPNADVAHCLDRMRLAGLVPPRVIAVCERDDVHHAPEVNVVLRKPYAFERLVDEVFGDRPRVLPRTRPSAPRRPTRVGRPRLIARSRSRVSRAPTGRG